MQTPLDPDRLPLLRKVLDTKYPVLVERVEPDALVSWAHSEEHLQALRGADPKSVIVVPLVAQGVVLGLVSLVSTTPSRLYGPSDVRFSEELARRAGLWLENVRLYRAAQRATRARDDMLGIVAHDLRSPLGNIMMQAQLLRRQEPETERRSMEPAELIERATKRMNRLIQDLLDVTRMEAGRLSVEQARLPARQVASDCLDSQRALAASASLELRLDVAPDVGDVWADRDRLFQVFENLIGNAVKFTKPGGRITVGAVPLEREILFCVSDTGAGISDEQRPHVFDRFWQARDARHRGAGLGLPIVKGIVEAHGGRIWVDSAPGRGSSFFFTIPSAPPATERVERASSLMRS
jgi:signal transduction histidine kinase